MLLPDNEGLICPRTNVACTSADYCCVVAERMVDGQVSPDSFLGAALSALPPEISEIKGGDFCSLNVSEALSELAIRPGIDTRTQDFARTMSASTARGRALIQ